jgi:hypothetical protein
MSNEEVSRIKIKFLIEGLGEAEGELVRFMAPRTVDTIARKMPLEGRAALYKEEIYFEIPIKMGEEKAKPTVETGAIAFWPMGGAICIFYGKSQTNVVLFPAPMDGKTILSKLDEKGFLIRVWDYQQKEWCRVSIGTADEMKAFVKVFDEVTA